MWGGQIFEPLKLLAFKSGRLMLLSRLKMLVMQNEVITYVGLSFGEGAEHLQVSDDG